jgi:hypothetical protein
MGVLGMYSGSVQGQVTGYPELGKEISKSIQCIQLNQYTVMDHLK